MKFMWELVLGNNFQDKASLKFVLDYSVYDKTSTYKYGFDVFNFVVSSITFSLFCVLRVYVQFVT